MLAPQLFNQTEYLGSMVCPVKNGTLIKEKKPIQKSKQHRTTIRGLTRSLSRAVRISAIIRVNMAGKVNESKKKKTFFINKVIYYFTLYL